MLVNTEKWHVSLCVWYYTICYGGFCLSNILSKLFFCLTPNAEQKNAHKIFTSNCFRLVKYVYSQHTKTNCWKIAGGKHIINDVFRFYCCFFCEKHLVERTGFQSIYWRNKWPFKRKRETAEKGKPKKKKHFQLVDSTELNGDMRGQSSLCN